MDQIKIFLNKERRIFIWLLILLSCSVPKPELPTVTIDPYQRSKIAYLSQLSTGMDLVKLETESEALVTTFSWIVHIDQDNIIFKSGKSVLIFDRQGIFLQKIHALGGGPEEYNTIISVMVDPSRKELFIADYRTIKVFNYQGKYLRTLNFPFVISGAFKSHNGNIIIPQRQIYSQVERTSLTILDSNLNVIKHIPSSIKATSEVKQNLFYASDPIQIGDEIFYKEPYSDTLFRLEEDSLRAEFAFDLKGRGFTVDESISTERWHHAKRTGKIPPFAMRVTPKYFFLDYYFKEGKCLTVVNNEDQTNLFHKCYVDMEVNQGIINDLDSTLTTFWPNYTNGIDIIAQYIYPENLSVEQRVQLGVKEDDNPIVIIASL